MAGRLRSLIESVVFAGMKAGSGPSRDPLYVSNRTIAQKVKLAAWVAIPCLIVLALTVMALLGIVPKPLQSEPQPEAPPAQVKTERPPDPPAAKVDQGPEVELVEFRVNKTALTLEGILRNNTDHAIRATDMVFELADITGSQLGRVSARVENVGPRATRSFRFPIQQRNAAIALVRELRTE